MFRLSMDHSVDQGTVTMSKNVEISTAFYESAHHRKPRGFGLWYFRMPDGLTFSFAGTYVRATRAAVERARVPDRLTRIHLCP